MMPASLPRRAALAGALFLPSLARAQGPWPNRPVRVIVPFTPGGSTDIIARALAAELQAALGQPFVVENRGGAGGTIGTELVAHAAPDGHTLLMGHIGTLAVNPALYPHLSYDTVESFAPIVLAAVVPNIMVVNPRKLAANGIAELIALAKRQPGVLTYGSGGNGSAAHIAMVAFNLATGTTMQHVPYRGTAPMLNDLIGGTIDLTFTGGPPALPPVRAGTLRALGVSSLRRLASAPDIPTITEQGVNGFDATQWYGLLAPAGTPRAIVERLNTESARILSGERLRQRLEAEGAEPSPGPPEAFRDFILTERSRWAEVVRRANMRPD
ncbi:Bug family tripartite tricarboxylate transporter substrate binding protein [Roseomonas xinghualingensis]|uniref:Bug family tripartite tricarboxylate transporter substrate binding protein n=1 Tax=Roseomonas xinghualingensis TaxID=2986475 RepID=UPI0021F24A1A|nr:tripartite tricarboxylate transporter substrate binding protein [Roseomonas sp. SXEYE001]MCV4206313.1 tripartite tricarboxylate transporter substrate binding protein [Roseomonas sp. SXEYE001]